jgi:hypothetical protein
MKNIQHAISAYVKVVKDIQFPAAERSSLHETVKVRGYAPPLSTRESNRSLQTPTSGQPDSHAALEGGSFANTRSWSPAFSSTTAVRPQRDRLPTREPCSP